MSKNDRIVLSLFAIFCLAFCFLLALMASGDGSSAAQEESRPGLWLVVRYDDRGRAVSTWWTKSQPVYVFQSGLLKFSDGHGNHITLADRWAHALVEDPLSLRRSLIAPPSEAAFVGSNASSPEPEVRKAEEEFRRGAEELKRGVLIPPYNPEVPEKF